MADRSPEDDVVPSDLPSDLPRPLAERLPEPRRRLPQADLRDLFVDLCRHRPPSSHSLARLLGDRDYRILTCDHLNPLVQECRHTFEIPEMPQHPSQQ